VGSGTCVAVGVSQDSNSTATKAFVTSYGAASTVKKVTITCTKGKSKRKVTAVRPVCPSGYKLSRLQ
jgi:ribosomal protein L23